MFWKPSEVILKALEIFVWTFHIVTRDIWTEGGMVGAKAEILDLSLGLDFGSLGHHLWQGWLRYSENGRNVNTTSRIASPIPATTATDDQINIAFALELMAAIGIFAYSRH
jgi:hypothetical protein